MKEKKTHLCMQIKSSKFNSTYVYEKEIHIFVLIQLSDGCKPASQRNGMKEKTASLQQNNLKYEGRKKQTEHRNTFSISK